MKKVIVLMMTLSLFISCSKNNNPSNSRIQQTSGKLIYENPAGDGAGLYYLCENGIIILNPDAAEDPVVQYAAFINIQTN